MVRLWNDEENGVEREGMWEIYSTSMQFPPFLSHFLFGAHIFCKDVYL